MMLESTVSVVALHAHWTWIVHVYGPDILGGGGG